MEHLGAEFGVILNDSQLREAVIAEARRPRPKKRRGIGFRMRLARGLNALAARIEPLARRDKQSLAESLPLLDGGMRFGGTL